MHLIHIRYLRVMKKLFAARPKKQLTPKDILVCLGIIWGLLGFSLTVMVVWPGRAAALSPFIFFALGVVCILALEIHEGGVIGQNPQAVTREGEE